MNTAMPELIAGKYEVLETVGKGGMGTVYKAIQRNLDRVVAIKMLSEELASDPEFRARFQQEAHVVARLNHPNIVQVHDIETHKNTFCIIMEFVEGENLQFKIDRDTTLNERDVVQIGAQVSRALHYAHGHGVIHRDVKPDNIHVTPQGVAKVMDFGIARFLDSKLKTQTGISMGTPKFMSPEQVTGKNVDGQTDLYSLGICLYYCLAGKPPFDGDNAISVATRHLYEQPEPPSRHNSSITPGVEKVIMKALEKQKSNRYQDGAEMAEALEATLGLRTPVRLTEEPGDQIYSGATQRVPTQSGMASVGTQDAIDTQTSLNTPVPEDLPRPEVFTQSMRNVGQYETPAQVRRGPLVLLAVIVFVAGLLIVIALLMLARPGAADATAQQNSPDQVQIVPQKSNASNWAAVKLQIENLLETGKPVEARQMLQRFQDSSPTRNNEEVSNLSEKILVQLPLSEKTHLAKRRENRGAFFLQNSQQKDAIAYAYFRAAAQLDPAIRKKAGTSTSMQFLDERLGNVTPTATSRSTSNQLLEQAGTAPSGEKERLLLEAATQDFTNVAAWQQLGEFYEAQNRTDDARVMYHEGMQRASTAQERTALSNRLEAVNRL